MLLSRSAHPLAQHGDLDRLTIRIDRFCDYVVSSIQLYDKAFDRYPIMPNMEVPKFLLADNTDFPASIFIVHTEYPRFIIDLKTDEVEWLEEFSREDESELESASRELIGQATAFYDREIARYED